MAVKANYHADLSVCSYQAPQYQYFLSYTPQGSSAAPINVQINGVNVQTLFDESMPNRCAADAVFTFCNNTVGCGCFFLCVYG